MIDSNVPDPCHLHCPWHGREMCVRCLLSQEAIADHHLSLGVSCGLRHIYFPNELPPCVHHNGELDWHYADADAELDAEHVALV